MNRSILIVICDFLLVSLLAFSTVDINKVAEEGSPPNMKMDLAMSTNKVESGKSNRAVGEVRIQCADPLVLEGLGGVCKELINHLPSCSILEKILGH